MDIFGNNSHLKEAVDFFIYDTIKIFILLILFLRQEMQSFSILILDIYLFGHKRQDGMFLNPFQI